MLSVPLSIRTLAAVRADVLFVLVYLIFKESYFN